MRFALLKLTDENKALVPIHLVSQGLLCALEVEREGEAAERWSALYSRVRMFLTLHGITEVMGGGFLDSCCHSF